MGAHDNSMPKREQEKEAQVNRRRSNSIKKADDRNVEVKEVNLTKQESEIQENENEIKEKDCTTSIREDLYLKSFEVQNMVQEQLVKPSSIEVTKYKPKTSEKLDSVMTSNQSLVSESKSTQQEINIENYDETKQERGQTHPERVNRISVVKLKENPNNSTMQGNISGVDVTLLVDTGATLTCLSDTLWQKLKDTHSLSPCNRSVVVESTASL